MVRRAPAAARSVEILDFLATHPGQHFTLTEIAGALEMNTASTLTVLHSLLDGGYVNRHPRRKTFALGPALLVLGQSALAEYRSLELAIPEMRSLAADVGTEVALSVMAGTDMLVLRIEGKPRSSTNEMRAGARMPFAAPFGAVVAAWSTDEVVRDWLRRTFPIPSQLVIDQVAANLGKIRERGYSIGTDSDERARIAALMERLIDTPGSRAVRDVIDNLMTRIAPTYLLDQVRADDRLDISFVAAPVFGPDGVVLYEMAIIGLPRPCPGGELLAVAERLKTTVSILTKVIGTGTQVQP